MSSQLSAHLSGVRQQLSAVFQQTKSAVHAPHHTSVAVESKFSSKPTDSERRLSGFSARGDLLWVATGRTLRFFCANTSQLLHSFDASASICAACEWHHNGRRLVVISTLKNQASPAVAQLIAFDIDAAFLIFANRSLPMTIVATAISASSQGLVLGTDRGRIILLRSVTDAVPTAQFDPHSCSISAMCEVNAHTLAVGYNDGNILLVPLDGSEIRRVDAKSSSGPVAKLKYEPSANEAGAGLLWIVHSSTLHWSVAAIWLHHLTATCVFAHQFSCSSPSVLLDVGCLSTQSTAIASDAALIAARGRSISRFVAWVAFATSDITDIHMFDVMPQYHKNASEFCSAFTHYKLPLSAHAVHIDSSTVRDAMMIFSDAEPIDAVLTGESTNQEPEKLCGWTPSALFPLRSSALSFSVRAFNIALSKAENIASVCQFQFLSSAECVFNAFSAHAASAITEARTAFRLCCLTGLILPPAQPFRAPFTSADAVSQWSQWLESDQTADNIDSPLTAYCRGRLLSMTLRFGFSCSVGSAWISGRLSDNTNDYLLKDPNWLVTWCAQQFRSMWHSSWLLQVFGAADQVLTAVAQPALARVWSLFMRSIISNDDTDKLKSIEQTLAQTSNALPDLAFCKQTIPALINDLNRCIEYCDGIFLLLSALRNLRAMRSAVMKQCKYWGSLLNRRLHHLRALVFFLRHCPVMLNRPNALETDRAIKLRMGKIEQRWDTISSGLGLDSTVMPAPLNWCQHISSKLSLSEGQNDISLLTSDAPSPPLRQFLDLCELSPCDGQPSASLLYLCSHLDHDNGSTLTAQFAHSFRISPQELSLHQGMFCLDRALESDDARQTSKLCNQAFDHLTVYPLDVSKTPLINHTALISLTLAAHPHLALQLSQQWGFDGASAWNKPLQTILRLESSAAHSVSAVHDALSLSREAGSDCVAVMQCALYWLENRSQLSRIVGFSLSTDQASVAMDFLLGKSCPPRPALSCQTLELATDYIRVTLFRRRAVLAAWLLSRLDTDIHDAVSAFSWVQRHQNEVAGGVVLFNELCSLASARRSVSTLAFERDSVAVADRFDDGSGELLVNTLDRSAWASAHLRTLVSAALYRLQSEYTPSVPDPSSPAPAKSFESHSAPLASNDAGGSDSSDDEIDVEPTVRTSNTPFRSSAAAARARARRGTPFRAQSIYDDEPLESHQAPQSAGRASVMHSARRTPALPLPLRSALKVKVSAIKSATKRSRLTFMSPQDDA